MDFARRALKCSTTPPGPNVGDVVGGDDLGPAYEDAEQDPGSSFPEGRDHDAYLASSLECQHTLCKRLFVVRCNYLHELGDGDRVTPMLFIKASTDPVVQSLLSVAGQCFGSAHRAWLRDSICGETDARTRPDFHSDTGLSSWSFAELIAAAEGRLGRPEEQAQAIRGMLKHFSSDLATHARRNPCMYAGCSSVLLYWRDRLEALEAKGLIFDGFVFAAMCMAESALACGLMVRATRQWCLSCPSESRALRAQAIRWSGAGWELESRTMCAPLAGLWRTVFASCLSHQTICASSV